MDLAALGVDARHDVLDGSVFAGGVHGLKNEEQPPLILGIEFFLKFGEKRNAIFEGDLGFFLVGFFKFQRISGVELGKVKSFLIGDAEGFCDLFGAFYKFVMVHFLGVSRCFLGLFGFFVGACLVV